jgi:hypothetical protein
MQLLRKGTRRISDLRVASLGRIERLVAAAKFVHSDKPIGSILVGVHNCRDVWRWRL